MRARRQERACTPQGQEITDKEKDMQIPPTKRQWLVLVERGALRTAMTAIGLGLSLTGLAVGVSLVMVAPGLLLGFTGVGLVVWGVLGHLPIEK